MFTTALFLVCAAATEPGDFHALAQSRRDDLRLSTYMTARTVQHLFDEDPNGDRALGVLRGMGIGAVYLEVYRSGLVVEEEQLVRVRDFLRSRGMDVVGGIATVPGDDFGVRQEGPLGWFNWQHPKTRADLEAVMRMSARVFDRFIIDDFLCTGDISAMSREAKGERDWGTYRRDLLVDLSSSVFIGPAREVRPDIEMIIKYPQWYDRFHLFGYDVARQPALFDQVWVGTETRGARTQRYGFVQPYEGFVNYRWLAALSGDKIGGAWFDHGDCGPEDFLEQAYQSVLAGAPELVLFNYGNLAQEHGGHDLLRGHFGRLADLAAAVAKQPVTGVPAYKPANSPPGGDMYLMDFLGMLGLPVIPTPVYPEKASAVFLPTQAAHDEAVWDKMQASLREGVRLIVTAGFVNRLQERHPGILALAGLTSLDLGEPLLAESILLREAHPIEHGLRLAAEVETGTAAAPLKAMAEGREVPFLTTNSPGEDPAGAAQVIMLNVHTFSQADFDAVGEVLLCPKPLGLLEIPAQWSQAIQACFAIKGTPLLLGPPRVTSQPLGNASWVLYNYNLNETSVRIQLPAGVSGVRDAFTGEAFSVPGDAPCWITIPPRTGRWLTW